MTENITPLTEYPVPELSRKQLSAFTLESIHAEKVLDVNPHRAIEALQAAEGTKVIGADFGGDKGVTKLFIIKNGQLELDDNFSDYVQGNLGEGYLESLERTAAYASEHNIPVGISWGAPLAGTRALYHPKASIFLKALGERYQDDFKNLIPTLQVVVNDGPAGLISGLIEASKEQGVESVLFPINGGGLGMAVLHDGALYSTEAGHVQVVDELNKYGRTGECGVFDATHVCIEMVGANKAGIEQQWMTRHEYMRARDIEDRYKAGDTFAGELYDNSALIVSHLIQGTANAFGVDITQPVAVVVGHGGAFKFPYYGDRIVQILQKHNDAPTRLIQTHTYGNTETNACLDGAALAAVIQQYS